MIISDLIIPTNPGYDMRSPPERQGQYANPVTLSNVLIQSTNANGAVVESLSTVNRKIASLKADLADAEADIEDLEQELLNLYPAPTADRKSNKLLQSYLKGIAFTAGYSDRYREIELKVRAVKRKLLLADAEKDEHYQQLNHIKLQTDAIKTHLSWVKQDQLLTHRS